MKIFIVEYSHRYGIDAWPLFQDIPPTKEEIIKDLGDTWQEDKGREESIEIHGPFDLPPISSTGNVIQLYQMTLYDTKGVMTYVFVVMAGSKDHARRKILALIDRNYKETAFHLTNQLPERHEIGREELKRFREKAEVQCIGDGLFDGSWGV